MLLLYPGEQPVEGEAGPVRCIITSPENTDRKLSSGQTFHNKAHWFNEIDDN